MLICPGGQAGLAACLRGLAAPGAPVLVEAPTYLGALDRRARGQGLQAGAGAQPTSAASAPTCWPTRSRRRGARRRLLQPLFANPHGATLAPERRAAVLDAVRAAGAFLVEDDAFRDLALDPGSGASRRAASGGFGSGSVPPPLVADDRTATSCTCAR